MPEYAMSARFVLGLLVVLFLAVVIGLFTAHRQPAIVAAPVPTATPTPVPPPLPNHVNIVAGAFDPSSLTVHVGQKVTWVDMDQQDHSVSADNGAFDLGVLSPGESTSWTPSKPGTYSYGSYLDPQLHGVVVVQP